MARSSMQAEMQRISATLEAFEKAFEEAQGHLELVLLVEGELHASQHRKDAMDAAARFLHRWRPETAVPLPPEDSRPKTYGDGR